MRLKIVAGDAGLGKHKGKDGSVGRDVVDGQTESLGKQRLHHEAHLVD